MRFEILSTPRTRTSAKKFLRALYDGGIKCGVNVELVGDYSGCNGQVLMLYGMGGSDRYDLANGHIRAGGRVVSWDIGYWDRDPPGLDRKYRLSIDGLHPPQFIMRGPVPNASRLKMSAAVRLADFGGKKDGYILLPGNGPKSTAIGAKGWSAEMAKKIRQCFPDRKIAYRPKPRRPVERDVDHDILSNGPIEHALAGAWLVVCRHSNVAVDACRAGVPVVCEDGAAAAIYPHTLDAGMDQPSRETRADFLRRLAWWQWSARECARGDVWPWLLEILNDGL